MTMVRISSDFQNCSPDGKLKEWVKARVVLMSNFLPSAKTPCAHHFPCPRASGASTRFFSPVPCSDVSIASACSTGDISSSLEDMENRVVTFALQASRALKGSMLTISATDT